MSHQSKKYFEDSKISVVVPIYNEESNIGEITKELKQVLEENFSDHEVLFVDDGSTDGSTEKIEEVVSGNENFNAIFFKRNFGKSAALTAGIENSEGDVIVTIDGDLQNDPRDIPRLIEKLSEGYDCVSGWRKDRKDPITKTIPSKIQEYLAKKTGSDIHDFGCGLKAYRSEAIKKIGIFGERHRFIPAELYNEGFSVTEIPVNHRPREQGESKYGALRLMKGSLDLFFQIFRNRFSMRPLHLLGGTGIVSSVMGLIIGSHLVIMKYFFGESLTSHLPRLLLSVGLVLFGILLVMFGFVAEMVAELRFRGSESFAMGFQEREKKGEINSS